MRRMSDPLTGAERVGRQVRVALAELGRSQAELVGVLGMTHASVTRRTTGQVSFRADELIAIADYLGVDPARFLQPIPQPRTAVQAVAPARPATTAGAA